MTRRFTMDDHRFRMPEARQPPSLNERLFGTGGEGPPPLPREAIERAAYQAIGLPHPGDLAGRDDLHHHLGTFRIAESEAATTAAIEAVMRNAGAEQTPFYDLADYRHAVASIGSLQSRLRSDAKAIESYDLLPFERTLTRPMPGHSTSDIDRQFMALFKRATHTANLKGYLAYLRQVMPPLATLLETPLPVYFPDEPRITHTYLIGTTGSGKTELMKAFIHSYVTQPKSAACVVLDPAGDFAKEIMAWPEFNVGSRLIYIRHDLARGMVPAINPFDLAGIDPLNTSREAILGKRVAAQELLSALSIIIGGGQGADFSVNMERLLMPCLLTLFDRPGSTLIDLQRFMIESKNRDLVAFAQTRSHYKDVVEFFSEEFHEPRFDPTKGSISTKLGTLFATGFFVEMTCRESTIKLEEMLNQRKILVFDLSKGKLGDQESMAIGRLIIAALQSIAKRRDEVPKAKRVPIHVFIDECHNYLSSTVKEILRESRKYGLHMTLAQQNVGQEMSQEMRRSVTGLTNVKICGKMEPDQRERAARQLDLTAERIAELDAGKGAFFVRFGAFPPFKLQTRTDLLGGRHRMTPPSLRALKARQLRAYYRPVDEPQETRTDGTTPPSSGGVYDDFD